MRFGSTLFVPILFWLISYHTWSCNRLCPPIQQAEEKEEKAGPLVPLAVPALPEIPEGDAAPPAEEGKKPEGEQ